MIKLNRLSAEILRALRNFRYERTPTGLFFPAQKMGFGGVFSTSVDDGPWAHNKNTVLLEGLDAMLSCYLNAGAPPAAFYLAPFTNNVAPADTITGATFAGAQGEYTGYTELTRQPWTPNGNAAAQTMSNSTAPAVFTIGTAAATIAGAALIATDGVKGGITGVGVAAALFNVENTLNPGSTLKIQYSLAATPV